MNKNRLIVIGILALIMGASFYLRVILPHDYVFTEQWVKFTSNDAYWHMSYIDYMAPNFPNYVAQMPPPSPFQWLLAGTIYCIGLGQPSQHLVDTLGAYFPVVLGILTIIPVYFLGRVIFNKWVGLIAACLIAVLPGEWLGRSSLGFTDHHVLEVLLSTLAALFIFMALKQKGKTRYIYLGFMAVALVSYYFAWGVNICLLYTSPSPRDRQRSRMPSSA